MAEKKFEVKQDFAEWALQFSGCNGGDIGSPDDPAIWVCGKEFGGDWGLDEGENLQDGIVDFREHFRHDRIQDPRNVYYREEDFSDKGGILALCMKTTDRKDKSDRKDKYRYDRNAFKLLAAINGKKVEEYQEFALKEKPFYEGGKGYFKMNLFPLGFKDTNNARWDMLSSEVTGFPDKNAYQVWLLKNRLPVMREWVRKYRPKLIICTGLGNPYPKRFMAAFGEETMQMETEKIAGARMLYGKNSDGTLIVIMSHLSRFNSHVKLQAFGERIRELLTA